MNITIKTATLEDLQKVQELNLELFKGHLEFDSSLDLDWTFGKIGTGYYQDRISKDDGCVLVAVVDDEIVGYLCGGMVKGEDHRHLPIVAELENTFVADGYRSKGIGEQLYNRFVEWCKGKDVGKIKVEADAQNDLAIKFYRNNGFKDYAVILEADI